MREHPILFSAPMIRAILDDRKTATRRLIRFPLNMMHEGKLLGDWGLTKIVGFSDNILKYHVQTKVDDFAREWVRCPFGCKGDRLWVRETWSLAIPSVDPETGYVDDFREYDFTKGIPKARPEYYKVMYDADFNDARNPRDDRLIKAWRPSIHMPRWSSRITLELTKDPAPQRVQEITEEDAIAEGIEKSGVAGSWKIYDDTSFLGTTNPIRSFANLWNSIHGPGAWERNPWVWVLRFRRVKP